MCWAWTNPDGPTGTMERRKKYSRLCLQKMERFPVLLVVPISTLVVLCSLVRYAECVMSFPEDSGVYSLFPDEDLKTGRKRFRFDEDPSRSYRDGRAEFSGVVRSYPMLPHDRLHRPVSSSDYTSSRPLFDYRDRDNYRDREREIERERDRERHGRVYFDDNFRSSRFDFRLPPRPRPIETPVSPIVFETSRPLHHHFAGERFPPPAIGQSKLPVGAANRASGEDVPTRIHIFNPESNSFGNPRNAGGSVSGGVGSSSERTQGPPSNFVETGPPGPESFLNHEEFLEYQKKIAFARFHGQEDGGTGENAGSNNGKKVLFESKEPFEVDGLIPPDKSGERKLSTTTSSKVPVQQNVQGHPQRQQHHHPAHIHQFHDQRQGSLGEGQKFKASDANNGPPSNDGDEERESSGGGEVVESGSGDVNEKGEEEESENGKSEVTQLPPTHITKSGRAQSGAFNGGGGGSSGASGGHRITPSLSYNEDDGEVGGTGFRLPVPSTTTVSYRTADEPPNLHGFVPVVPFHLGGAEQPRTISLERQRQQQQHHIIPPHHAPQHTTTTATTTRRTTTVKSIPVTTTTSSTVTSRAKVEYSGFRPAEVTKSFSPSSAPAPSSGGDENTSNIASNNDDDGNHSGDDGDNSSAVTPLNKNVSGPPASSPILHATAGERSNSETHSKVAITKQQELKRLQKQRHQLEHQLTVTVIPPVKNPPGISSPPDTNTGLSDSSSSFEPAEISESNPGTLNTHHGHSNDYIQGDDDTSEKTYIPQYPTDEGGDSLSLLPSSPATPVLDSPHSNNPIQDYEPESHQLGEEHNYNSEPDNAENDINSSTQYDVVEKTPNTPPTSHNNSSSTSSNRNTHDKTNTDSNHADKIDTKSVHHVPEIQKTNSRADVGNIETIKSTPVVDTNNANFDTQAILIANGIKQGEFTLEGYMINDGGGPSNARNEGVDVTRADDYHKENEVDKVAHHHHQRHYDYPDEYLPSVGTSSPELLDDGHPFPPLIIPEEPQLPGVTTPDLQPHGDGHSEQVLLTPFRSNSSTSLSSPSMSSHTGGDGGDDVTGSEYFSRSNEPMTVVRSSSSSAELMMGNPVDHAFEPEPTPLEGQEFHRSRFSEHHNNGFAPTNPYAGNSHFEDSVGTSYSEYGNLDDDNSKRRSSASGSLTFGNVDQADNTNNNNVVDDINRSSSSIQSNEVIEENEDAGFEHDDFDRLGKSFRYGSYVNGRRKPVRKNKMKSNKPTSSDPGVIVDSIETGLPPSISVPVEASLSGVRDVPDNRRSSGDSSSSSLLTNHDGDVDDDMGVRNRIPLYLESSETLLNKTYYLDGNFTWSRRNSSDNRVKYFNFIKVTRIKGSSGPSSKETVDKTTSSILARRNSKQAVIVSEESAGTRPKVIGSVVEAGPAWPGLVNSFLRSTNRTFTATVRPRGNSGTNPSHPTTVISSHVQQQQMKQQMQTLKPTEFQLPQPIRHNQGVTSSNGNPSTSFNRPSSTILPSYTDGGGSQGRNRSPVLHTINATVVGGGNLVKAVSSKLVDSRNSHHSTNGTAGIVMDSKGHVITSRRLYSSEEDSSSAQSRSNASIGVVSMVHAHISHCPKLHAPTEVICDVHIREGHGIPNPQLTVGWRRKFYNSTQPDVLLTLHKAPASGENGHFDPHHSVMEVEDGKHERLEEFHDKFNVTLAPGISPMLRSVLLIRSVSAPDTGTYQCEVQDGVNVLKSETLLFLCH